MCRVFRSLEVIAADDWVNHAVVAPFLGDKLSHTFFLGAFLTKLFAMMIAKLIIFILIYHVYNLARSLHILTFSQVMTLTELALLFKILVVLKTLIIILIMIIANRCNLILCSTAKIVRYSIHFRIRTGIYRLCLFLGRGAILLLFIIPNRGGLVLIWSTTCRAFLKKDGASYVVIFCSSPTDRVWGALADRFD